MLLRRTKWSKICAKYLLQIQVNT